LSLKYNETHKEDKKHGFQVLVLYKRQLKITLIIKKKKKLIVNATHFLLSIFLFIFVFQNAQEARYTFYSFKQRYLYNMFVVHGMPQNALPFIFEFDKLL